MYILLNDTNNVSININIFSNNLEIPWILTWACNIKPTAKGKVYAELCTMHMKQQQWTVYIS